MANGGRNNDRAQHRYKKAKLTGSRSSDSPKSQSGLGILIILVIIFVIEMKSGLRFNLKQYIPVAQQRTDEYTFFYFDNNSTTSKNEEGRNSINNVTVNEVIVTPTSTKIHPIRPIPLPTSTPALTPRPTMKEHTVTTTSEIKTQGETLLGCNEIKDLKVIRFLSRGNNKFVFDVELPGGEIAIVKRCVNKYCVKSKLIKESNILKKSQSFTGSSKSSRNIVSILGECEIPYKSKTDMQNDTYLREIASNLTGGGYTLIVEKGTQMIERLGFYREQRNKHDNYYHKCIVEHLTPVDYEDFRSIARMYADFPDGPLLFNKIEVDKGDSRWFDQYVFTKRNGIANIDFDWSVICKDCTYDQALQLNCKQLRLFIQKKLNCTMAYSLENPVVRNDELSKRLEFLHKREANCSNMYHSLYNITKK